MKPAPAAFSFPHAQTTCSSPRIAYSSRSRSAPSYRAFSQASSRPRLVFLLPYTLSSFCSPICFSVNYRFSLSPSPRLYGSLCLQHHAAIMTSMPSSSWRPREAPPLAIKGTTWIWKKGADHFGFTKEGDYFSLESWQETVEKKAEESKSKEGSFRREQRAVKKKKREKGEE